MEVPSKSSWTKYLMFCTCVSSFSSLLFGYNISVVDAPGKVFKGCILEGNQSALPPCILVDLTQWALVVSIMCIGALSGCLLAGWFTNFLGRKRSILYNSLFYVVGLGITSLAFNFEMLVIGRFFTGIGVGVTTVAVPLYLTEIASDDIRGSIGSFHQFATVIGVLLGQSMGIFFAENVSWRYLFAIPCIGTIVQSIFLVWICESPKYLAGQGNLEASKAVLSQLRGRTDFLEPETLVVPTKQNFLTIPQLLFFTPIARKSMITGIVMHLGQQFSGINAVLYFSATFFEGFDVKPAIITACLGALNLLVTILSVFLIDRVGRRSLLLFSTSAMCLCGVLLTICMATEVAVGRVVLILLFVASFSIGIGPVTWLILNEIFPREAISGAVSIAVGVNWISNFIVGMSFESVAKALGNYAFLPFSVILALFFLYTFLVVPETKGRPVSYL